jgi:effector-binding domain-containing protein
MELTHARGVARPMLYVTKRCSLDMTEIGKEMTAAFATLGQFLAATQVRPLGPPLTVYHDWTDKQTMIDVGFPVAEADLAKANGTVLAGRTPEGDAIKTVHHGAYVKLADTYAALEDEMRKADITMGTRSWEVYLSDPETTPQDDLVTEIYMQVSAADATKLAAA